MGTLGLFQKKIPGEREEGKQFFFSVDGRCRHFSNYMGHWCLTKSDCMGGGVGPCQFLILWVVVIPARKGRKEYYLLNH